MDLAKGILQGAFSKADADLDPIPRDSLNAFLGNLGEVALGQLGTSTLQYTACLEWIAENVLPSVSRANALAKYLIRMVQSRSSGTANAVQVSYSSTADPRRARHVQSNGDGKPAWYATASGSTPGLSEQTAAALTVLCLFDATLVLAQTCPMKGLAQVDDEYAISVKPYILDAIRLATSQQDRSMLEVHIFVQNMICAWTDTQVFDTVDIIKVRNVARTLYRKWLQWTEDNHPKQCASLVTTTPIATVLGTRSLTHGHKDDVWHRLPAGCLLPHIDGRKPIRTSRLGAEHISKSNLDPLLLDVVNQHIAEADASFALPGQSPYGDDSSNVELNGLGLRVVKHPKSGKRRLVETYYGHSVRHLNEVKKRSGSVQAVQQASLDRREASPLPGRRSSSPPPTNPRPGINPHATPQSLSVSHGFPHSTPSVANQFAFPPPPPPPPLHGMHVPPIPPRPAGWNGAWPPPPPVAAAGMAFPFPPPPPPPPPPQSAPALYHQQQQHPQPFSERSHDASSRSTDLGATGGRGYGESRHRDDSSNDVGRHGGRHDDGRSSEQRRDWTAPGRNGGGRGGRWGR